jgi:hypothetical protein
VVEIAERTIDAASFESLAARYGGAGLADGHRIRFIREVNGRRSLQPSVVLDSSWTENMERSISPEVLQSQRESFARGDLIYVRAPLSLTRKSGQAASGAIDLFVRRAADETSGRALFIRGSLTVPNESTCFPSRRAFAALVAYGIAAEFLRDAENPAHTKWNGQAERLKENWRNPGQRLNRIRHSLRQLHDLLAQAVEWKDENALIRVLSVRDPAGIGWPGKDDEGQGTRPPPPRPPPPIRSRPKLFSVKRIASGFVVAPEAGLTEGDLPLVLEVRAGYDLARGDPFKKHSPFDFDLTRGDGGIIIEAEGATVTPVSANALRIDAATTEFEVRVAGFDTRRDLRIRAVRESR